MNRCAPGPASPFSDIEVQTRHTLAALTKQIEANGSDWQHCHHVRVWLTEPRRDYRGFLALARCRACQSLEGVSGMSRC